MIGDGATIVIEEVGVIQSAKNDGVRMTARDRETKVHTTGWETGLLLFVALGLEDGALLKSF